MLRVDQFLWTVLEVVGMVLLAAGALTIMLFTPPQVSIATVYIAVGIAVIVIASVFIGLDGRRLRKEDHEFRRFEEIRDEARNVPNDLKEGYFIDYTAEEPSGAISYVSKESEGQTEQSCICSDDIQIFCFN